MTGPSWSRSSRWTAKPITAEAVAGSLPAVLVGRIKPGGGLSTASDWPGLICNFSVRSTWLACQRPHGAATCRAAAHTDHLFLRGLPAFADDLPNRADRRVRAPGPRPGPITEGDAGPPHDADRNITGLSAHGAGPWSFSHVLWAAQHWYMAMRSPHVSGDGASGSARPSASIVVRSCLRYSAQCGQPARCASSRAWPRTGKASSR